MFPRFLIIPNSMKILIYQNDLLFFLNVFRMINQKMIFFYKMSFFLMWDKLKIIMYYEWKEFLKKSESVHFPLWFRYTWSADVSRKPHVIGA